MHCNISSHVACGSVFLAIRECVGTYKALRRRQHGLIKSLFEEGLDIYIIRYRSLHNSMYGMCSIALCMWIALLINLCNLCISHYREGYEALHRRLHMKV